MEDKKDSYVTYKWLITTMLATLAIAVSIIALVTTMTTRMLDLKVNKEVADLQYRGLCEDMTQIKQDQRNTAASIDKVSRNMELVLRALKIEPVK